MTSQFDPEVQEDDEWFKEVVRNLTAAGAGRGFLKDSNSNITGRRIFFRPESKSGAANSLVQFPVKAIPTPNLEQHSQGSEFALSPDAEVSLQTYSYFEPPLDYRSVSGSGYSSEKEIPNNIANPENSNVSFQFQNNLQNGTPVQPLNNAANFIQPTQGKRKFSGGNDGSETKHRRIDILGTGSSISTD